MECNFFPQVKLLIFFDAHVVDTRANDFVAVHLWRFFNLLEKWHCSLAWVNHTELSNFTYE